jgi:hypothetical protein
MSNKNGIKFTKKELIDKPCAPLNPWLNEDPPKQKKQSGPTIQKGQKTKNWISMQLYAWCKVNNLVLQTEVIFHPQRKWRYDWAIFHGVSIADIAARRWEQAHQVCAIEYEGLFSEKSRHTTIEGFSSDTVKYTEAAKLGWIVVRITATNYKTLFTHLTDILNNYQKNS